MESAEMRWVVDTPAAALGSHGGGCSDDDDGYVEVEMLRQRLVRTGPRASFDVKVLDVPGVYCHQVRASFDVKVLDVPGVYCHQVIKAVRKEILQGCKIVFSRVFPNNTLPQEQMFWKMAEYLGAVCSTDVDSSVTHVVTVDLGTEKARWAVKNKKFLVHPHWIEAANFRWHRQPEENFPVTAPKGKSREKSNILAGQKETKKDIEENSVAVQKDIEENVVAVQKVEEDGVAGQKETRKDKKGNVTVQEKDDANVAGQEKNDTNVAGQEKADAKENAVATSTIGYSGS